MDLDAIQSATQSDGIVLSVTQGQIIAVLSLG